MSQQDSFERTLALLREAALDDAHWPAASASVDELFGSKCNMLAVGTDSLRGDVDIFFTRWCFRGQRHEERERQYIRVYRPSDEGVSRLQRASRQPDRPRHRPLYRTGAEDFSDLQRGACARRQGRPHRAPGRPGGLEYRLWNWQSHRDRELVVGSARHVRASSAPPSPVRSSPPRARRGGGAQEHRSPSSSATPGPASSSSIGTGG